MPTDRTSRDETTAALLAAAVEMVLAHPEQELSGREVAANAGVNHGLVHRYFGKRIDLVGAVLDRLADQMASQLEHDELTEVNLPADTETVAVYSKVLARAILDGLESSKLQKSFPVLTALREIAQDDYELDDQPSRVAAAQCVALVLGWHLFEPWITTAAGLQDFDPEELRTELGTTSRVITESMRSDGGATTPRSDT